MCNWCNVVVTSGDFKTHIFTGDGNFVVNSAASGAPNNTVDYLVVAGGGEADQTTTVLQEVQVVAELVV